jgi:TolA-binding protein
LCALKKYDKVILEAGHIDINDIKRKADMETLWKLANTSRFLKRPDVAIDLFKALRKRSSFFQNGRSATATYLIAKTAMEQKGDLKTAEKYFKIYLNEYSTGSLYEEALGHLMDVYYKAGRLHDARRYASEYLRQYPTGLFAGLAEKIFKN